MIVIIEKIIYCSDVCGRLGDVHCQPPSSCADIKLRRNSSRTRWEEIVLDLRGETGPANSLKLMENFQSFLTRSQNFRKIRISVFFTTFSLNRKVGRLLRKKLWSLAFYTGKLNSKNSIQIERTYILSSVLS